MQSKERGDHSLREEVKSLTVGVFRLPPLCKHSLIYTHAFFIFLHASRFHSFFTSQTQAVMISWNLSLFLNALDAYEKKKLPDSQTSTRKTEKMWHWARNRLFRLKRWRGLTPSSTSCLPLPPPCSPLDYFPVRTDAISDCLGKARSSTSERGQGSDTCNKQSSVLFYPAPQIKWK